MQKSSEKVSSVQLTVSAKPSVVQLTVSQSVFRRRRWPMKIVLINSNAAVKTDCIVCIMQSRVYTIDER